MIGDPGVRFRGVSALTAAGFCVASVEYRLWSTEGDVLICDCVADAKDALRFFFKNAQPYSLDGKRIITFGDSAGGQIAQMPLLSQPDSISGKPTLAAWPKRLVAGVTWFGLCDFEKIIPFNPKGRADFLNRFGSRIIRAARMPRQHSPPSARSVP